MSRALDYLAEQVAEERQNVEEAGMPPRLQATALDLIQFFESRLKVAKLMEAEEK